MKSPAPPRLSPIRRRRLTIAVARRRLDWRAFWSHGENALHVAQRRGQSKLVEAIRGSAGLGCFAAATEFHITRALRILDALPAAGT